MYERRGKRRSGKPNKLRKSEAALANKQQGRCYAGSRTYRPTNSKNFLAPEIIVMCRQCCMVTQCLSWSSCDPTVNGHSATCSRTSQSIQPPLLFDFKTYLVKTRCSLGLLHFLQCYECTMHCRPGAVRKGCARTTALIPKVLSFSYRKLDPGSGHCKGSSCTPTEGNGR